VNIDTRKLVYACYYPVLFLGLLWLVKLLEFSMNLDLYFLGNYPLSAEHLPGIIFQPLLHENLSHLWSNTIPLFFLIWSLFYFYGDISFKVFGLIWVGSGAFTWLIGRPSFHIGASGIVYGLVFFLFFSGLIRKMRDLMALSAIVAFLYGSLFWSMLPVVELWRPELSWEGHLSGAFAGALLAIWFRHAPPQRKPDESASQSDSEELSDKYWIDVDDADASGNNEQGD
jgi:membrane associated rhomboid family serine protease